MADQEYQFPPPLKDPAPPMADQRFWSLIDESRERKRFPRLVARYPDMGD
jgi:hypothetical protein